MAKITFGGVVSDARNKLGDVVYARGRGGAFARAWVIPPNPKTVGQTANRALFTAQTHYWQNTLTNDQRQQWNAYADANPFSFSKIDKGRRSGFGWFLSLAVNSQRYASIQVVTPPPTKEVYNPAGFAIATIDNTTSTFNLEPVNHPAAGRTANVWYTKVLSGGITRLYRGMVFRNQIDAGGPFPKNFWADLVALGTIPAAGQHLGVKMQGFDGASGILSHAFYIIITAT
jgi:hypothetical protein